MSILNRLLGKKNTFKESNTVVNNDLISSNINETIANFKREFGDSPDIVIRQFTLGGDFPVKVATIHVDGLINCRTLQRIIDLLLRKETNDPSNPLTVPDIKEYLLNAVSVEESSDANEILYYLLNGFTIMVVDNSKVALMVCTEGGAVRSIAEPTNHLALKGPKEAFVESININVSLIRKRITSSNLHMKQFKIGRITKTDVSIMYLADIADEKIVSELETKLNKLDIDGILDGNYLEEMTSDKPWSIFPTTFNSERTDVAVAALLEGRVVIITDGSPFVHIVPVTIFHFFHAADNYYQNWSIASFARLLSISTFLISLILPSFYVAITTYHQELIPTNLIISLATQREGVPFPAFIEAFVMEIVFEILREASLRMPRGVGQAISFIGALVIGTAAVEAGFISAAIVIVVAMTAISSFTTPSIELAASARILRFGLLILAGSSGLIGILFGTMAICIHLTSIETYGVPYINGIAPFDPSKQKDLLVRLPWPVINKNSKKNKQK